jgi:hypothetical protein
MKLRTCVSPDGNFIFGIHKPWFKVANMREEMYLQKLGLDEEDNPIINTANFPDGEVEELNGEWIYEIQNPFPFRGATYIGKSWADAKSVDPKAIKLPGPTPTSMTDFLSSVLHIKGVSEEELDQTFANLPETVLLALASTSTDPEDLIRLAELSCEFIYDEEERLPIGLRYETDAKGRHKPKIMHHDLFEALVNNISLPDIYKEVMVLRPGAQGESEIVGEWPTGSDSHVFEYMRRNSYIPWGHYASNMAHDLVRYSIADISDKDFEGLRHLYYQRTYVRLAEQLGIKIKFRNKCFKLFELEELRLAIINELAEKGTSSLKFDSTLWGWNYGFDFAASGYRLHASHQQVHQQFAMVPKEVFGSEPKHGVIPSYNCGDLVADFVRSYQKEYRSDFFEDYIRSIRNNKRMDGKNELLAELIVYQDKSVMLFVPKAQTSQWELQLVTLDKVGNVLEADSSVRASLNRGIITAMRILTGMGARLITVIEFPKRVGVSDIDQRLLYSFLPKIPYSMGAFSEAQFRFISSHYPEDFAIACRFKYEEL